MGIDEEPGRCASVDSEKWCRQGVGAGRARSLEAQRAIDADHGPLVAARPCLRNIFSPFILTSANILQRLSAGIDQTDTPLHGPTPELSLVLIAEQVPPLPYPCP